VFECGAATLTPGCNGALAGIAPGAAEGPLWVECRRLHTDRGMPAYGASRPLRRLPAMVSFLSRKPALSLDGRQIFWSLRRARETLENRLKLLAGGSPRGAPMRKLNCAALLVASFRLFEAKRPSER